MKKIFTFLALSVIALTTLTSCDRDAYEANTLNGQWSGFISAYYVDRWGLVGSDYRTTINFRQVDTYGGTGYEVDYDLNDPYGILLLADRVGGKARHYPHLLPVRRLLCRDLRLPAELQLFPWFHG